MAHNKTKRKEIHLIENCLRKIRDKNAEQYYFKSMSSILISIVMAPG